MLDLTPKQRAEGITRRASPTYVTASETNSIPPSPLTGSDEDRARQLNELLRQQATIAELGYRALSGIDLETFMAEVLKALTETLGMEFAKILEVMPDGESLVMRAGLGWNPEVIVGKTRFKAGKNTHSGFTLMAGAPVVVEDFASETRFPVPRLLSSHGVVAGMTVIIQGRDAPYGVLGVHSLRHRSFTEDDINFLQAIANVLALMIERKQVENMLADREEQFQQWIRNLSDIITVIDERGTIIYESDSVKDILGWPVEMRIGDNIMNSTIVHPEDSEKKKKFYRDLLANPENPITSVFRLRHKNGEYRYIEARGRNLLAHPSVKAIVATYRDITERRKMEKQKDDFLAVASHELKTPVTSIKAFTQVAKKQFSKDGNVRATTLLTKMDAQIDKLTNLISDLLDVTKIEAGKMKFNIEYFDFNNLVLEVVDEVQATAPRHIIDVKLGPTTIVLADRERTGQVITNFLTNAIKYSPHADSIVVSTSTAGNAVTLGVRDFGIGIPESKRLSIFQRFYRVDGDTQDTFPGLGLGLYISKEIITRLHGNIWVESEEGKGSSFYFSLPLGATSGKREGADSARIRS
jgi:PAS domain S-box-containing protein